MLIPLLANISRCVIGEHFNATDEYRHVFAHVPVFVIKSACSAFPPPLLNQRFCFEQVGQIIPKARHVAHFFGILFSIVSAPIAMVFHLGMALTPSTVLAFASSFPDQSQSHCVGTTSSPELFRQTSSTKNCFSVSSGWRTIG